MTEFKVNFPLLLTDEQFLLARRVMDAETAAGDPSKASITMIGALNRYAQEIVAERLSAYLETQEAYYRSSKEGPTDEAKS